MASFTGMKLTALDLNLLLVLHTVLTEGSVARAATKLHVTPPAVSNALNRLRAALDDPLLVRSGRRLVPTPRALAMAPELRAALEAFGRAVEQGDRFDPRTAQRTFTLACSDADQLCTVPALSKAFAAKLPRARLRVLGIDEYEARGGLASPEIDAVIVPEHPLETGLHAAFLYEEEPVLVVRRDHPVARGRLTAAKFNALRHVDTLLVRGEAGKGHARAEAGLRRFGLVRNVAVAVPGFAAAAAIAASSDLAAGLPRRVARRLATMLPLKLLALPTPPMKMRVVLAWHERTHADPGSTFFRRLVLRAAGPG